MRRWMQGRWAGTRARCSPWVCTVCAQSNRMKSLCWYWCLDHEVEIFLKSTFLPPIATPGFAWSLAKLEWLLWQGLFAICASSLWRIRVVLHCRHYYYFYYFQTFCQTATRKLTRCLSFHLSSASRRSIFATWIWWLTPVFFHFRGQPSWKTFSQRGLFWSRYRRHHHLIVHQIPSFLKVVHLLLLLTL